MLSEQMWQCMLSIGSRLRGNDGVSEIATVLGFLEGAELIRRDNLVLL